MLNGGVLEAVVGVLGPASGPCTCPRAVRIVVWGELGVGDLWWNAREAVVGVPSGPCTCPCPRTVRTVVWGELGVGPTLAPHQ